MGSQIHAADNSSGFLGGTNASNIHRQMGSFVPSVNHHSHYKQGDLANNTNDLNPMIMMSGEEGSASMTNSQINMTHQYPHGGSAAPFRGPVPAISPSINKHNMTNDAANSSMGPNPFATQAAIGLTQLPLSSQASRSQSRVYHQHPTDNSTAGPHHHTDEHDDEVHRDQYGNYVAWTGRNHYQEDQTHVSYQGHKGEVFYQNRPNYINETQDRASIASKSGFLNVNDITGITRGGEVTAEGFNASYINGTMVYDRADR